MSADLRLIIINTIPLRLSAPLLPIINLHIRSLTDIAIRQRRTITTVRIPARISRVNLAMLDNRLRPATTLAELEILHVVLVGGSDDARVALAGARLAVLARVGRGAGLSRGGEAENGGEVAFQQRFGARHAGADDGDVAFGYGPGLRCGREPGYVGCG